MTVGSQDTGRLLGTLLERLQAPPWAWSFSWTDTNLLILLGYWTPLDQGRQLAWIMHIYHGVGNRANRNQGKASWNIQDRS